MRLLCSCIVSAVIVLGGLYLGGRWVRDGGSERLENALLLFQVRLEPGDPGAFPEGAQSRFPERPGAPPRVLPALPAPEALEPPEPERDAAPERESLEELMQRAWQESE